MEKVAKIARSFEEAERNDKEYYQSLTPQERMQILLELNRMWFNIPDDPAAQRVPRMYRIVNRK